MRIETPPYVDYTAKVSSGSFRPDRRVSPAVLLTRVEWGLVCAFAHCDTVLALRGVSRRLYATASDPRIWAQLIDRDMPRHTNGEFEDTFVPRLTQALQRDPDQEEGPWRALTSPTGRKVGRDKCLREEYGALRCTLWRIFLHGHGKHSDARYAERLRALLYLRRCPDDEKSDFSDLLMFAAEPGDDCTDWGLELRRWLDVAPTDRRDASALHALCFDLRALSVVAEAGRQATKRISLWSSAAAFVACDTRRSTWAVWILESLSTMAPAFHRVPFTPTELPIDPVAGTRSVGKTLPPLVPALSVAAAVLVALSSARALLANSTAHRATAKSTWHRLLVRSVPQVLSVCDEAVASNVVGVFMACPALAAACAMYPIWRSWSTAAAAAYRDAAQQRSLMQGTRAAAMRSAAGARGETGFHIEAKDLSLTDEQAAILGRAEKLAISRTTVAHALGAAAIAAAAWKAKDAAALFQGGVLALPVSAAIDTMPPGNVVWSVAWTLMVSAHRCTSAEAKDQPSLSLHAAGLPTPFVPEDFPETADAIQARLDADKAAVEADATKVQPLLFVDEAVGTVAQGTMRAVGCPVWLVVTFRVAVTALQCVMEARAVSLL